MVWTLDVVFVDGLHTYQQALKDVNNSLINLNEKGVIIIHDCNPPHEAAAYPADSYDHAASLSLPGWTGEWCGDVWKTICYLRSHRNDLKIFVLDCDYGLGIVMRGEPDNDLDITEDELDKWAIRLTQVTTIYRILGYGRLSLKLDSVSS
jgi:hypothetical protein